VVVGADGGGGWGQDCTSPRAVCVHVVEAAVDSGDVVANVVLPVAALVCWEQSAAVVPGAVVPVWRRGSPGAGLIAIIVTA